MRIRAHHAARPVTIILPGAGAVAATVLTVQVQAINLNTRACSFSRADKRSNATAPVAAVCAHHVLEEQVGDVDKVLCVWRRWFVLIVHAYARIYIVHCDVNPRYVADPAVAFSAAVRLHPATCFLLAHHNVSENHVFNASVAYAANRTAVAFERDDVGSRARVSKAEGSRLPHREIVDGLPRPSFSKGGEGATHQCPQGVDSRQEGCE